jgi:hypothetical protein
MMSRVASLAMFRRAIFLLALLLIGGVGLPTRISAHPSKSSAIAMAPSSSSAAISAVSVRTSLLPSSRLRQAPSVVALLIAGIAVSLLAAGSRRRRVRILQISGCSLLLITTGFEGAIHSVHHLGDPSAAERCLVASSSQHVTVVECRGPDVVSPLLQTSEAAPPAQPARTPVVWLPSDAGRAPPA